MAKAKKKIASYEDSHAIKKIDMYVTIVNQGQATAILKIFERIGASAQFVQRGRGTAQKEILDILGIEDNGKEIIISLIKKELVDEIKMELEAFFMANKKNRGIGFAIPLTSLIGVKVYQFLTDSL